MQFTNSEIDNIEKTASLKRKVILREQKKLEKMVREHIEKGGHNIGQDFNILKQSTKLDKLIVDEMTFHEMGKKIKE